MEDDTLNQPVIKFNENFWGEKYNGWEVLYKNLRCSIASVKEFEQYLRECVTTEDTYVKNLDKIKLQILKFSSDSSLSPIWQNILKELNHSNSIAHLHFKYRIEELIKDIQNYYDDLRKKKQKIKETETRTLQLVELIRTLSFNLTKSKELYFQAYLEVEKQSAEVNQTQTPNLAAQLTLQKLDRKCQSLKDEYLTMIEKFNSTRVEFEHKFTESCNLFQQEEQAHLKKMRSFLLVYTQLVAQLNSTRQKNFNDCQQQLNNVYTNDMLLQQLVVAKATGQDKPAEVVFVETNFDLLEFRSINQRASFSSQNIHRSHNLSDLPDTAQDDSSKLNQDYDSAVLYSSSVPNTTNKPKQTFELNSANKSINDSKKKNDGLTFNFLEIFARSKSKTDFNKKSSKSETISKINMSSSYSFLPSFLLSSSSKDSDMKSNDTDSVLTSKKAVEAVSDTFDKQLKQIDTFEEEIKQSARSSSTDPVDIRFNSTKGDDESGTSPSKRMTGKKGQIRFEIDESSNSVQPTSPINLFKKRDEKPSVGSLMTATSIDNNIIFDNSGLFENVEDYVDSLNVSSFIGGENDFFSKMNSSQTSRGLTYAISESSDDELAINKTSNKNNSKIEQSYDNPVRDDEIEENSNDDLDSDNDSDDSDAPKRVFLKIKPLSEVNLATSPEVLREISKNLQLRPNSSYVPRKKVTMQRNTIFQATANESLTSISSINNILPSSSPSLSSDRDAASRSHSALGNQQVFVNLKLDENNNNLNANIFQMDRPLEAAPPQPSPPPLPPLPLNLKQKYHDIINQPSNKLKSDSSLENLNYDCLSDLSMNNSPNDQNFAKF